MLFSKTAEYALRAIVYLADHTDVAQTTQQIADATQVPANYLSKTLQGLGRAGLVQAQRGVGGGFALARPAETLTVLDVVNAVDPVQRIVECPLHLSAHGANLCPLHRKLDDAMAMIEKAFGSTRIVDLLRVKGMNRPLCDIEIDALPKDA